MRPLPDQPLISVLIDTYYRPAMLRHAVEAIRGQTYADLDIVLIDNGSTPETKAVLAELEAADSRIRLVRFTENQFSWDDPHVIVRECYNAGLAAAKGDLVFHQADDDWLAPDFFERMVALFRENPACTTAIGVSVGVRPDGSEVSAAAANQRPRFMPGHEMALAVIDGKPVFGSPGFCFVMRRDVLEAAGGFHDSFEQHMLYGIVAFGVTGFDSEARMYWGYHEGQLNKALRDRGWVSLGYTRSLLDGFGLERRWAEAFGPAAARTVAEFIERQAYQSAAEIFAGCLAELRPAAIWRSFRAAAPHLGFWKALPAELWEQKRLFAANLLKLVGLKPLLNRLRGRGV
ncbi:glycosyltransferase family 2 protein [Paramagnetospirillum magneticum]|uniref:Glycosyltransferase n=1 Tax=Paramagnetospirillum magneticum (strain ATCC 700264 / AMB-1) TaxID=342108 RepID=Q2WBB4_PARM1|nr:glycosyltransferase family 2 protein [Paramagnetospirillum magneticum]BAE48861.1 Glycosyltransferase [Paramagnetospirillum magneticum AMB-1]